MVSIHCVDDFHCIIWSPKSPIGLFTWTTGFRTLAPRCTKIVKMGGGQETRSFLENFSQFHQKNHSKKVKHQALQHEVFGGCAH